MNMHFDLEKPLAELNLTDRELYEARRIRVPAAIRLAGEAVRTRAPDLLHMLDIVGREMVLSMWLGDLTYEDLSEEHRQYFREQAAMILSRTSGREAANLLAQVLRLCNLECICCPEEDTDGVACYQGENRCIYCPLHNDLQDARIRKMLGRE